MATTPVLEPVDLARCQADKSNGVNFMTFGGVRKMVRCRNAPTMIATERVPGEDGTRGSMSLCDECRFALVKQLGSDYADFKPITD